MVGGHPTIGAVKKAIELGRLRTTTLKKNLNMRKNVYNMLRETHKALFLALSEFLKFIITSIYM